MNYRFFSLQCLSAFLFCLCTNSLYSSGNNVFDSESVTKEALDRAFSGDWEMVGVVARQCLDEEKASGVKGGISEDIQVLSLVAGRSLPTLGEFRDGMDGYRRDQAEKNIERLLRRQEPRQRFIEARKDRRYEQQRQLVNNVITPVALFFQGQFSAVFGIPFNGLDYYFTGRKYPTPGKRKELYTTYAAAQYSGMDPVAEQARKRQGQLLDRRRKLEVLHCDYNGDRAFSRDDFLISLFWYKRKMQQSESGDDDLEVFKVLGEQAQNRAWKNQSNTIADGDALFYDPEEFSAFSNAVSALFLEDSEAMAKAAQKLSVNYPSSHCLDDVVVAQASLSLLQGEGVMAVLQLEEVSRVYADEPWASKSKAYLQRPMLDPEVMLEEAKAEKDKRYQGFLWTGKDPTVYDESLSAELCRQRRRTGFMMAQRLFLPDMIGRALFLPFMEPFPQPEMADAAGYIDLEFLTSPEGEKWLKRISRAQQIEKRWQSAIESARLAGDEKRVVSLEKKVARSLEKLGDKAPRARDAVSIYTRLLSAYPSYYKRLRVEEKLEGSRRKERAVALITLDELKAWPELWKDQGFYLSPQLLNGKKRGGEITSEGMMILQGSSYAYTDKETGRFVEVPMEEKDFLTVLHLLESRRRMMSLDRALRQPNPRKRVPLSLEAGVFPGFDVSPGLVPLDVSQEEMRLYE
jgi:hypothetical protein